MAEAGGWPVWWGCGLYWVLCSKGHNGSTEIPAFVSLCLVPRGPSAGLVKCCKAHHWKGYTFICCKLFYSYVAQFNFNSQHIQIEFLPIKSGNIPLD